jgi:hypothetical protein
MVYITGRSGITASADSLKGFTRRFHKLPPPKERPPMQQETSSLFTPEEAVTKRQELVEKGFCVIPGVLPSDFIEELQAWSDDILEKRPVAHKYRYQGSDIHVATKRRHDAGRVQEWETWSPMSDRLIDWPLAWKACREIGLEDQRADDSVLILSKPAHGPALYWHQDWMQWDSPASATPWPTRIFLSYYLTDTTPENGCLRAIPGTHLKRIPLHDVLPAAHEEEIQAQDESHLAFMDHPDAVDLPVKAGDLVLNDARLLHAAYPNRTDKRRTLLLQWHNIFRFPNPPSWWEGEVPDEIKNADPTATYPSNRVPGKYLK